MIGFFANDLATIFTYSLLYLTVIFLWIPGFKKFPLWCISLILAIIFGLVSNRIDLVGIIFILLFVLSTYGLQNQKFPTLIHGLFGIAILVLGIGLETHFIPGFHNLKILDRVQISQYGIPFTLYLNFDKTIVGIFILGMLHQLISSKGEWLKMFKATIPRAILVCLVILYLSIALKFVHFDPKLPSSFLMWACTNLLFVCVAEEAFFRGFIQKYLYVMLQRVQYGNLIAIIIASILFGLAHYPGGAKYMILAAVAGVGYGWIYFRAKHIEASILTHFSLNLLHFLFFTYPALPNSLSGF